jgi:hypothetical protein
MPWNEERSVINLRGLVRPSGERSLSPSFSPISCPAISKGACVFLLELSMICYYPPSFHQPAFSLLLYHHQKFSQLLVDYHGLYSQCATTVLHHGISL